MISREPNDRGFPMTRDFVGTIFPGAWDTREDAEQQRSQAQAASRKLAMDALRRAARDDAEEDPEERRWSEATDEDPEEMEAEDDAEQDVGESEETSIEGEEEPEGSRWDSLRARFDQMAEQDDDEAYDAVCTAMDGSEEVSSSAVPVRGGDALNDPEDPRRDFRSGDSRRFRRAGDGRRGHDSALADYVDLGEIFGAR